MTYSLGNELSDLGGGKEEQKTKHKDHRLHGSQDQAKDDQTFSVKVRS